MADCFIYGLCDPRTGEIRYVGQTKAGMSRPRAHWSPSTLAKRENPHTANWLNVARGRCRPFRDESHNLYLSQMEAAEQLGLRASSINAVLNGRRNSVYGHFFKYV